MYTNLAYLGEAHEDIVETDVPLLVTGCGYYHVRSSPVIDTRRPEGRGDYQLLYIAAGKAKFYGEGREWTVSKGNMVLFRPGVPQMYDLFAADSPETYWVHFTGRDVEAVLAEYGMPEGSEAFYTSTTPDYAWLFRQMIQELQLRRVNYEELLNLMLRQIFVMIGRYAREGRQMGSHTLNEMERAVHYFNENYSRPIVIADYAAERHMSVCLFIRSFRQMTKLTPMQYILQLRLTSAKNLLTTTDFTVGQIAAAVGYDNPLYFSRLFHKHIGVTPSDYRRRERR